MFAMTASAEMVTSVKIAINANSVWITYASDVVRAVRNVPSYVPNAVRNVKAVQTISCAAVVVYASTVSAVRVTTAPSAESAKTAWSRSASAVTGVHSVHTFAQNVVKNVLPVAKISFV